MSVLTSPLIKLKESRSDFSVTHNHLRELYRTEHIAYAENFLVSKQQLLRLLDALFEINKDAYVVFKIYRDNLEKNLQEKTVAADIHLTLTHVKKALEEVYLTMRAYPRTLSQHDLQQTVNLCLGGAAENMLTIARLFLSHSLQDKLIQAKRELIKCFALEYIKVNGLLIQNTIGNEIHFVHGLFDCVADTYGLETIKDRFTPRDLCDANHIHVQGFQSYVCKNISDAKIIHQLMLLNPLPHLDAQLDFAFQQLDVFFKGLDSQVSIFHLYQWNEDENALIPKENIRFWYEWLLYGLLLKRGWIASPTFVLKDEQEGALECIRLHDQVVIVEKNKASTMTDNPIHLREFTLSDTPFIVHSIRLLLEKSDDDLSLYPMQLHPLFIDALRSRFNCQLFGVLIRVVERKDDKVMASILKDNSSNMGGALTNEWLRILSYRGLSETLLGLLEVGRIDKRLIDKICYGDGNTLLITAVCHGHVEVVRALLNVGADKEVRRKKGGTPLYVAAQKGYLEVVEALLSAGANKEAPLSTGVTPLFVAAQMGHLEVVQALLNAGANKEAQHSTGATPLYVSAQMGHLEVVEALLKADANIDAPCADGSTPLNIAAQKGHLEVVKALLRVGANEEAQHSTGATPLLFAAKMGHLEVVEALLRVGANKEKAQHSTGATPLFVSVQMGHLEVVKALLNSGANKEALNLTGATPLYTAAQNGHLEVVKALLNAGANKGAKHSTGATPLHVAAQKGRLEVVEALLNAGANKDVALSTGETPLLFAAKMGHLEVVEALLRVGANKEEEQHSTGATPLFVSVQMGHLEVVKALLNSGANKEALNLTGETPLFVSVQMGHLEVVKALLNSGANKQALNLTGATPLYTAAKMGHLEVLKELLSAGANKDARCADGATPLHTAVFNGHLEVVKALLNAGANKGAKHSTGATPLHVAAQKGRLEVVEALLNAGANKEAPCAKGATPLYVAAEAGYLEVVQTLLLKGANKDAPCADGATPLFIAAQKGHIMVLRALLNAGANREASIISGETPLFIAAKNGHYEAVKSLLMARANKEVSLSFGATPLFAAVLNGHYLVVEELLRAGANKEASFIDGTTPIFFAAKKGYGEIVGLLIDQFKSKLSYSTLYSNHSWKKNIASPCRVELSILRRAIQHSEQQQHFEELLCKNNLNDKESIDQLSTLHLAIILGHQSVIEVLEKAMSIDDYDSAECPIKVHELKKIFAVPDTPAARGCGLRDRHLF